MRQETKTASKWSDGRLDRTTAPRHRGLLPTAPYSRGLCAPGPAPRTRSRGSGLVTRPADELCKGGRGNATTRPRWPRCSSWHDLGFQVVRVSASPEARVGRAKRRAREASERLATHLYGGLVLLPSSTHDLGRGRRRCSCSSGSRSTSTSAARAARAAHGARIAKALPGQRPARRRLSESGARSCAPCFALPIAAEPSSRSSQLARFGGPRVAASSSTRCGAKIDVPRVPLRRRRRRCDRVIFPDAVSWLALRSADRLEGLRKPQFGAWRHRLTTDI